MLNAQWDNIISYALTAVVIPFVIGWLRAEKENAHKAALVNEQDRKQAIINRVRDFIFNVAESFAEKRFPELAQDILAGRLNTKVQVRTQLRSWGGDLRDLAIDYFKGQGIDIVAEFGLDQIGRIIEQAANSASPFPGKSTADALLTNNKEGAQGIADNGIHIPQIKVIKDGDTSITMETKK